jgi:hypothetical protein
LEIWYDWLGFVPRRRLGQIVPQIGDRRFASIVQKFLHEYREITIDRILIVRDPNGPRVLVWQNVTKTHVLIELADAQMPANITNFNYMNLRFAHTFLSVIQYLIWEINSHNSRHTDICGTDMVSQNNFEFE